MCVLDMMDSHAITLLHKNYKNLQYLCLGLLDMFIPDSFLQNINLHAQLIK